MKLLRYVPIALAGLLAVSTLLQAPKASAALLDIQCTPPDSSALIVSGTVTNLQPAGACTTNPLSVSSNGYVAGTEVVPLAGYSPTYDSFSGAYVIPETETTTNNFVYDAQTGTTNLVTNAGGNNSPSETIVSVNSSGEYITTGLSSSSANPTFNLYGTNNAVISVLPASMTSATAIGDNNAVIGQDNNVGLYVSSTGAVTTLNPTGLGATLAAVNSTGVVAGTASMSTGDTRAFITGSNGTGTTLLGTANGVSSTATSINSNGQVGGYITLASGQTEAFITNARGGLFVGIGAGASSDSTEVISLNSAGQAIVNDTTTGAQYFYSSGAIVPMASIFTPASNPNAGCSGSCQPTGAIAIDNYGQIVFNDPAIFTPNVADYTQSQLLALSGAVSLTSTTVYQNVAAAQAPATLDPSFSSSIPTQTSPPPAPSVPAPLSFGLLGLGAALMWVTKRKSLVLGRSLG